MYELFGHRLAGTMAQSKKYSLKEELIKKFKLDRVQKSGVIPISKSSTI